MSWTSPAVSGLRREGGVGAREGAVGALESQRQVAEGPYDVGGHQLAGGHLRTRPVAERGCRLRPQPGVPGDLQQRVGLHQLLAHHRVVGAAEGRGQELQDVAAAAEDGGQPGHGAAAAAARELADGPVQFVVADDRTAAERRAGIR